MANEAKIIITADASGAITGIKQVGDETERLANRKETILQTIKGHWLAVSASIAGAILAVQKAWNLAEKAAQFEEQMMSLNALASQYNTTADVIVSSVKSASQGLISMADAASVSAKALMMGMKPDQLVEFMKIVEKTTNVTGMSVAQSFEYIVEAASTGRERTLKQMGILVDLNNAYGEYAKSLNKTIEELSELERQQAAINAILAKGSDIISRLGDTGDSTSDKMERLRVTIADLELKAGALIVRFGVGLVGAFNALMVAIIGVARAIVALLALFEKGLNKLGIQTTVWQDAFKEQTRLIEQYTKGVIENFSAMVAKSGDLVRAKMPIKDIGSVATTTSEKIKDLNKQIQDLIDKSTLTPVELIKKQAVEWLKAGADRVLVERWVQIELEKIERERMRKVKEESEKQAKELALAKINIVQKEIETRMAIEQRLDEYRLKIGKITEEEMITRRYERERQILSARQEALRVQMAQEESEARLLELSAESKRITEEINALKEYEAYELDILRLENQRRFIEEQRRLIEEERKVREERWAEVMGMLGEIGEPELEKGLGMVATRLKAIEDIYMEHYTRLQEMGIQHNLSQLAWDEITAQQRIVIAQNLAGMLAGAMYSLYVAANKHNKTMFTMYKAFAITEALISTYAGAARALKDFPFPFSVAVAALVTAMGLARVAMIASLRPGAAISAPGSAGGYKYAEPTLPKWEAQEKSPTRHQVVNVHIYGNVVDHDAFAREIIPSIQKAANDGVR